MELLAERGVDATWRRSVAEALAVIELLDERVAPLERELRHAARDDGRVVLLETIPGVGDLLGLTLASEIGDVARFPTPRKLIGYAGLAPRVHQSGERSHTGALSKAGSRTLRWAAVEAAHAAWRPTNPWHHGYRRHCQAPRQEPRQVRRRAQDPDRLLAHPQPPATLQTGPLPGERHRGLGKLRLLSGRLTAPHGIEKPRQLPCSTSTRLATASASANVSSDSDPTPSRRRN